MSIKKALKILAVALAPHLSVLGVISGFIIGATLMSVSAYFNNALMFFLSFIITLVLPPVLMVIGDSLEEKYRAMQNEVDIIAMIPEWSLGLEMLASVAIMIASVVLKSFAIFYLGAWLLFLGISLGMAKEINGLKEDLRSPDLEKRRAAMEKVESDKQIVIMTIGFLLLINIFILITASYNAAFHPTMLTPVEVIMAIILIPVSFLPCCIVYGQVEKVMPPEPEKAARAAS